MPSQIGYFDTLKSVAGKVFTYLASITLTGTDGKTITVTENVTLDGTNLIPVGMEMLWPTETVPTGFLEENGASLLRAGTYAALFAVIGTMYGTADGTHFNLPDMRGKFPRIWDHAAAVDPDRAGRTVPVAAGATVAAGDHVGTEQVEQLKSHAHAPASGTHFMSQTGTPEVSAGTGYYAPEYRNALTGASGGNETRPINAYRMMIIKY